MKNNQLRRIVIKVGSNVLSRKDGGLDITRMSSLVDQVTELRQMGIEVIIVSSGAMASGFGEVKALKKLDSVEQRQLFSAVGQAKLINRYYELFREHHIVVGQVLTTKESFGTRGHYLNQKSCMSIMLENDVIPIVNENDTISVTELMFTDNDELSGLIAAMMDAQLLVILSNIDGIYNGDPNDPESTVLREIGPEMKLEEYIKGGKSSFGRGGMLTKTRIARKVAEEGIAVIIANGRRERILPRLIECLNGGEDLPFTRFTPSETSISSIKKWIAHSEGFAKGEIHLNKVATAMLANEFAMSILPVGITAVIGEFEKDDIVRVIGCDGRMIGVGRVSCSKKQVEAEMGKHGKKPVIHYDYLFVDSNI